jgi:hypothetical protein
MPPHARHLGKIHQNTRSPRIRLQYCGQERTLAAADIDDCFARRDGHRRNRRLQPSRHRQRVPEVPAIALIGIAIQIVEQRLPIQALER